MQLEKIDSKDQVLSKHFDPSYGNTRIPSEQVNRSSGEVLELVKFFFSATKPNQIKCLCGANFNQN